MICACHGNKIVSYQWYTGLQKEIIILHDDYLMNEPRSEEIITVHLDELVKIEIR
jgi:hypothetical protein